MVTAAIGNFEESERVTLDHHTQEQEKITSEHNITAQLDNKFATDIRSYALLLLELVAAWNKHNGKDARRIDGYAANKDFGGDRVPIKVNKRMLCSYRKTCDYYNDYYPFYFSFSALMSLPRPNPSEVKPEVADISLTKLLGFPVIIFCFHFAGESIKVRENKKSAHKSPYYLQRPLPVKPRTATCTSQQRNRRKRRISSQNSRFVWMWFFLWDNVSALIKTWWSQNEQESTRQLFTAYSFPNTKKSRI